MAITLKSAREIALMRQAGAIVAETLELLRREAVPGVTTQRLDRMASEFIVERGGIPSFLGYEDFPASICTSLNAQVIHGIPGPTRLQNGDLLKVDVGVWQHGYHADAAATFAIGEVTDEARALIDAVEAAFQAGLGQARAGRRIGDIGAAIQAEAERRGFSVIEDFGGHGVGQELHEEPDIPNTGEPGTGLVLRRGMTLAIEPMIAIGDGKVDILDDYWTVVTLDGGLSAHYEHTVAISDGEPELLTVPAAPMV